MEPASEEPSNVETFSSLKEAYRKNYLECKRLLNVESKKDPKTDPYRSIFKVRDIFLEDAKTLKNNIEQIDPTDTNYEFCKVYLPLVYVQIGVLYVDLEEFTEGVDYLNKCLNAIENPLHPNTVWVSIKARNSLGYVCLRRSKPEEAVNILQKAEKLYYNFRIDQGRNACNIFEYLENSTFYNEECVETEHTMTKFYLAQAYGVLKDSFKSSVYCHETLKRQLTQKNFDPIDWALNSVTLSQFFAERMLFKQCRHHLAAANCILDEYENSIKNMEGSPEEIEAKWEEFRHRSADMSWSWAKYGIVILKHSKNVFSETKVDIEEENRDDIDRLWFEGLDLSKYENIITDVEVVAFNDAREVFLTSQRFLNKAKEYYTLEDKASKYVQIVRDHSQLFQTLSAFEQDKEREFKMLKKRVDMLEVVLKELNPRFYMDVCQQLWFELGEVYHDMMQLKYQKMEEVPTPQLLKKINSLIESSIKNFNNFLGSVRDKKTGELPDPIDEELIKPVLTAHFYLGRLYFKYITPDKRNQAENTKKAYEFFKYVVDFCDKNEMTRVVVNEKYNISKDVMPLLQMKLLQI